MNSFGRENSYPLPSEPERPKMIDPKTSIVVFAMTGTIFYVNMSWSYTELVALIHERQTTQAGRGQINNSRKVVFFAVSNSEGNVINKANKAATFHSLCWCSSLLHIHSIVALFVHAKIFLRPGREAGIIKKYDHDYHHKPDSPEEFNLSGANVHMQNCACFDAVNFSR